MYTNLRFLGIKGVHTLRINRSFGVEEFLFWIKLLFIQIPCLCFITWKLLETFHCFSPHSEGWMMKTSKYGANEDVSFFSLILLALILLLLLLLEVTCLFSSFLSLFKNLFNLLPVRDATRKGGSTARLIQLLAFFSHLRSLWPIPNILPYTFLCIVSVEIQYNYL